MAIPPFSEWLTKWLEKTETRAVDLANAMGNSEAMISKWRNGLNMPDAANIMRLSEITGESHWRLASMAYGWPEVPATDDLTKDEAIRAVAVAAQQIAKESPELLEDLEALAQALLRRARKRKKGE